MGRSRGRGRGQKRTRNSVSSDDEHNTPPQKSQKKSNSKADQLARHKELLVNTAPIPENQLSQLMKVPDRR